MANGLPTFSCVDLGEAARAVVVEAEGDDRLAVALIEARLRVGQILAGNDHALLDHIGLVVLGLGALEQLGIRRHVALQRLLDRRRLVDQTEGRAWRSCRAVP